MKKLYATRVISMETENNFSALNVISELYIEQNALLKEADEKQALLVRVMKLIRKMTNEVGIMCFRCKDSGEAVLLVFDKEPDGKVYTSYSDDDGVYILVEE
jgi:hypothetical protein